MHINTYIHMYTIRNPRGICYVFFILQIFFYKWLCIWHKPTIRICSFLVIKLYHHISGLWQITKYPKSTLNNKCRIYLEIVNNIWTQFEYRNCVFKTISTRTRTEGSLSTFPLDVWFRGVRMYTSSPTFNSTITKSVEDRPLLTLCEPTNFAETGDELTTISE